MWHRRIRGDVTVTGDWQTTRASDADRERAADVLNAAFAEGRIDHAEHRRRLDVVMNATTYYGLQREIADLVPGATPGPPPPPRPGPPGNPWAGYHPPAPVRNEGMATASLILGIVSFVMCGIATGIPAIITGHMALGRIRASGARGRELAIIGLCLGYVSSALTVLGIVAVIALGLFGTDFGSGFDEYGVP